MGSLRLSVRLAAGVLSLAGAVVLAQSTASGASTTRGPDSGIRPRAASVDHSKKIDIYATYYGWYDNSPPGCATAYSGCAGGVGTFAKPITFASDKAELPVGTIVYYPTVEKYFVMGDDCQECDEDWAGKGPDGGPHLYHVDLWIGGKGSNEFDAINCEDALTQGMPDGAPLLTPFIIDPPSNQPVSTEPLFNARTNHCYGGATTSSTYGRYKNKKSAQCIEDPADSAKSGTPVAAAKCNRSAAEDIGFDGAFFVINKLCLQANGATPGTSLEFASCNGLPHQQWEINPNGTIAGIQSNKCIAESSGKMQLANCTSSASDHWVFQAEAAT